MKLNNVFLSLFGILLLLFLSQCCSSKEQVEDSKLALKRTNYPPPSLSHGTAEVTATILELITEKSKVVGLFKIDTVHGYGPSTRPVGVGSQLNIEFAKNLLKHNENKIPQIFKKNTKHRLLISSIRSGLKREDAKVWQIIIIK
jgi:hypothetical protein